MPRSLISFTTSGSTANTDRFLKAMQASDLYSGLDRLAQRGVSALQANTPQSTGLTAASWGYEIEVADGKATIYWYNTHVESGVNVAVILQYGHGTGTGGYVSGRDYINPAIQPVFDEIADEVWKKVTSA
jgi:hypothetical protein